MISERGKNYHMSVSVDGAIRNKAFYGFTDKSGKLMTKKQAEAHLTILQMNGIKLLPMDGCDNFDPEKGCLGHDHN